MHCHVQTIMNYNHRSLQAHYFRSPGMRSVQQPFLGHAAFVCRLAMDDEGPPCWKMKHQIPKPPEFLTGMVSTSSIYHDYIFNIDNLHYKNIIWYLFHITWYHMYNVYLSCMMGNIFSSVLFSYIHIFTFLSPSLPWFFLSSLRFFPPVRSKPCKSWFIVNQCKTCNYTYSLEATWLWPHTKRYELVWGIFPKMVAYL